MFWRLGIVALFPFLSSFALPQGGIVVEPLPHLTRQLIVVPAPPPPPRSFADVIGDVLRGR